jgi:hypothetical protein
MKSMKALLILLLFSLFPLLGQDAAKDAAKKDAPKVDAPTPDATKQDATKPPPPGMGGEWETRSFDVKYVDPEAIKSFFSGRSFVMQANRELHVLTINGPPGFVKEVEDAVKRFDIPGPPPADIQITIYLLATAAQAPTGTALPKELAAIGKEFGTQTPKLADSQILRVREGDSGQVMGLETKPDSASLSRVWIQSSSVGPGKKGDLVSLYGLRVWLNIPPAPGTTNNQLKADPDVSADIDIDSSQPVMVSKTGVDKPVAVVVLATVVK